MSQAHVHSARGAGRRIAGVAAQSYAPGPGRPGRNWPTIATRCRPPDCQCGLAPSSWQGLRRASQDVAGADLPQVPLFRGGFRPSPCSRTPSGSNLVLTRLKISRAVSQAAAVSKAWPGSISAEPRGTTRYWHYISTRRPRRPPSRAKLLLLLLRFAARELQRRNHQAKPFEIPLLLLSPRRTAPHRTAARTVRRRQSCLSID